MYKSYKWVVFRRVLKCGKKYGYDVWSERISGDVPNYTIYGDEWNPIVRSAYLDEVMEYAKKHRIR